MEALPGFRPQSHTGLDWTWGACVLFLSAAGRGINGGKKRCVLQRLRQKGDGPRRFAPLTHCRSCAVIMMVVIRTLFRVRSCCSSRPVISGICRSRLRSSLPRSRTPPYAKTSRSRGREQRNRAAARRPTLLTGSPCWRAVRRRCERTFPRCLPLRGIHIGALSSCWK